MNFQGTCYWLLLINLLTYPAWSEINEKDFSNVNDIIVNTHAPLIEKKFYSSIELKELFYDFGGAFKVDSVRKPLGEKRFILTLTGDIPMSRSMSMDGYAIVACHELGHILGGEPRQTKQLDGWSSVEGQADYFATNQCMWNYIANVQSNDVIHDFDRDMVFRCDMYFGMDVKKNLGCLRIMSGIGAMIDYFNRHAKDVSPISINNQDATEVNQTLQKYPSAQCRIDTFLAGLFTQPRPRCWFKA